MKHGWRLLLVIAVGLVVAATIWLWGPTEREAGQLRESLRDFWGVDEHGEDDDDDDDDAPSRVELVSGRPVVRLSEEQQRASGIVTEALQSATLLPEISARATVVDLSPLLELRAEVNVAAAQRDAARRALSTSRSIFEQLRQLHAEGGNVSARAVSEAEARMLAEQATMQTAEVRIADLRTAASQRWGEMLVGAALADSPAFQRLRQREEALLLVTLPPAQMLPEQSQNVFVAHEGRRSEAREAHFIDSAPSADATLQGETYFYQTAAHRLRIGMRLDVWIPVSDRALTGVKVPNSAIVWHAGSPWAYTQQEDGGFIRHQLQVPQETAEDWFVGDDVLQAGQQVVVSGGQMLLSEEYRWSIPDEDDVP